MDVLKAEIERKKRLLAEKNVLAGPDKKYFKRGDLRDRERDDYLRAHNLLPEASGGSGSKADHVFQEIMKAKEEGRKKLVGSNEDDDVPELPRNEVIRRLRDRMEPILLFAETHAQACIRLRQVEMDEPEPSAGLTNDFKEASDRVDRVYLEEMIKSQGRDGEEQAGVKRLELKIFESKCTYEELLEMANDLGKGDSNHDSKVVQEFIVFMMTAWAKELNNRDETVKMSVKGKMDSATYAQTRTYLKPLLRMLRKQTVTDDIADSLVHLVKFTLQRDYIASNEAYMEMAIGNAPWPIGVTNAGIHARPARENIFSKHVAHVLNDETQRKFIQGLKRLLTKAQQYYPTDPSRSVDFVKRDEQQSSEDPTAS